MVPGVTGAGLMAVRVTEVVAVQPLASVTVTE